MSKKEKSEDFMDIEKQKKIEHCFKIIYEVDKLSEEQIFYILHEFLNMMKHHPLFLNENYIIWKNIYILIDEYLQKKHFPL